MYGSVSMLRLLVQSCLTRLVDLFIHSSLICVCVCKQAMYYRTRLMHKLKVDETKIQRLTDLGLDMKGGFWEDPNMPKPPPNKRETNWETNLQLMKDYKEEFGLSAFSELKQKSTSPGKYKHLYNWVRIFYSLICLVNLLLLYLLTPLFFVL